MAGPPPTWVRIRDAAAAAACAAVPLALTGAGWAAYAALAWAAYGRHADRRPDALLDRFMPVYEIGERHETRVAAPAEATYAAARSFDLRASLVIRALFRGRELLMGAPHGAGRLHTRLLDQTLSIGWRVLAEDPG